MTPTTTPQSPPRARPASPGIDLEQEINGTGRELLDGLLVLLDAIPDAAHGPQRLSRAIGVDKVLASRVLKATRTRDPISALFAMPGPEPLRRLVRGAVRHGLGATNAERATAGIDRFERLIRVHVGDRGALDTIVSAWVPDARREFELRRKQAAFKAMSQLKGVQAQTILSTVFLHPAEDGEHLDIVWLSGFVGLHRLRPGAPVRFATRRVVAESSERRPRTLDGAVIEDLESLRLAAFCSDPLPPVRVQRIGEVTHYVLGDDGFGPRSALDIVLAEVNRREMRRTVPRGSGRRSYLFAEASIPAVTLQFDAFVHEDVYPGSDPRLRLYDTAFDGVADINDPAREVDRLELMETIDTLGRGRGGCRSSDVPRYHELVTTVFERLGWNDRAFRGYRCRIEYPVHATQVAMVFDPPEDPA